MFENILPTAGNSNQYLTIREFYSHKYFLSGDSILKNMVPKSSLLTVKAKKQGCLFNSVANRLPKPFLTFALLRNLSIFTNSENVSFFKKNKQ